MPVDSQRDLLPLTRDPLHARASLSTHFPPVCPRQGEAGVGVLMEKLNNAGNTKPSGENQSLLRSPLVTHCRERGGKGREYWCLGSPIISELQTVLLTWAEN